MNVPPETIPKTWDEMAAWTEKYERDNMRPAKTNSMVGKRTVELLLWWVPGGAPTAFAKQCVYALLGEPLREAMMYVTQDTVPTCHDHESAFYVAQTN